MYLTINMALPDSSGNQLIILTAKIKYNDQFLFHNVLLSFVSLSPPKAVVTFLPYLVINYSNFPHYFRE